MLLHAKVLLRTFRVWAVRAVVRMVLVVVWVVVRVRRSHVRVQHLLLLLACTHCCTGAEAVLLRRWRWLHRPCRRVQPSAT
jgi:hypothetical protein